MEQLVSRMTAFKVDMFCDVSPGDGLWARACVELGKPCVSVVFNATHEQVVSQSLVNSIVTKMGTQGHRLFEATMNDDLHGLFSQLFAVHTQVATPAQQDEFASDDEMNRAILDGDGAIR